MKNEISLCMIVKDEEDYLPGCLESVKDIVNEIIIVDTGSTDRTVEIAKTFGAQIHYFQWNNNFSEARNESLKYATKDWILILDADDEFFSEDKENFKLLLNQLDEKAVYFFETLSYCGSDIDNSEIIINLNPRLFKNNCGIHYEGEIHNQLVHTHNQYDAICNAIKIHHYGYLNKRISDKDKRNRNITILKEQIDKNPDNKFAYFNLGNEYAALGDMKKALEYYYKAYEDFDAHKAFGAMLLIRIINISYIIGEYNEAMTFIDIGIEYYPKCTDFYYFKALIFKELNRPTLEIKTLKKCIELGEAPSEFKFLYGTGSFRAYYELGNVYMQFKDYDVAYNYYMDAMRANFSFVEPIYNIIYILKEKNMSLVEIKKLIEQFFSEYPKSYSIIADLFYKVEYYEAALEYVEKCEQHGVELENITILKAKCFVRMGEFYKCISINNINESNPYYFYFSMYKVISNILINKYDEAAYLICKFKDENLSEYNKKMLKVYSQLVNLFKKNEVIILSKDEKENEYMEIILEICEIMLINNKIDELATAVELFNLIDNKFSLLYLGKLYNKYGYIDSAKNKIIKSIKEFDIYDKEGLDILSENTCFKNIS